MKGTKQEVIEQGFHCTSLTFTHVHVCTQLHTHVLLTPSKNIRKIDCLFVSSELRSQSEKGQYGQAIFVSLLSLLGPGSRVSKGEKEGERDDVRAPTDRVSHQANKWPQLPVSSGLANPTVRCWHDPSSLLGTWGLPSIPQMATSVPQPVS